MLATVLFILSLVVGAGLVWLNFFAGVGYAILTIGGIVFGPIALIGVINAIRDYASGATTKGQLLGDLLKRGLVLVLAAVMLWSSVPHNWNAVNDWLVSLQQEQRPGDDEGDPPPTDGDTGGDLSDYKIDMDEADLAKWLDEFNPNWKVEMLNNWDDSSMPSNAEARNKAVHDAGGKFEFCVSTPMQDLKILLDGSYDANTLAAIKKGIQKKIIMDPIYADGFVQACRLMAPEILDLNPWLVEYANWLDEVFGRTDSTQKGINALTNDLCSALTPYVFYNNVRLAVLFGQFTATGVESLESSHNWHLPIVAKASDTRLVESPEQESSAAVIFVARYKLADGTEGACAIKLGINVWDKRIELFDPKSPTTPPATQTPPDTTPTGTGDPGTTPPPPAPKTYSIDVIGYEYGTNKTVVVLSRYTAHSGLADKTTKTLDAPDVANYTPHKGYEQVKVTINGSNVLAEFFYDKTNVQNPTYKVTAIGYLYGTKNVVHDEYTYKTGLKDGETVNVPYKQVNGYTIHPGYESVKVTINGSNVRAEFYYDANTFPLYYQRGYYAYRTGTWTVLDQSPIFVGDFAAGKTYSFNVTAPAAPNSNTRYILRDGSPVTGTMPAEKTTLRVVCEVQHDIDISYKKVDGNTVTKAFEPYRTWVSEGKGYNIPIYDLPGYTAQFDFPTSGTMGTSPIYGTVFYWPNGRPQDGNGAKDPVVDPVNTPQDGDPNKSNAEVGGGKNQTTDGTGDFQQTEPGRTDYPEQGTQTTTTTSGGGTTTTTTDSGKTTTTTVTGGDKGTSGETGTVKTDSNVTADDGGTTHGGTAPGNNTIPVDSGTTVTTTTDNGNGTTTTTTETTSGQTFDGQYGGGEPT